MYKVPDEFPDLSNVDIMAIDVETKDTNLTEKGPGGARNDGYLLGVSIATNTFNCYFPLNHESGDNCDKQKLLSYLKDSFSTRCPKVGANILYDLEWLRATGIEVKGPKYDIQIAEWLLEEDKLKYSLDSLCVKYLGIHKAETEMVEAAARLGIKESQVKNNIYRLHPKDVAIYAAADAQYALDIWNKQIPLLKVDGIENVFYNIEVPLIDVLLDMRFKGVRVDVAKANELREKLKIKEIENTIHLTRMVDSEVDIWSGKDIEKHAKKLGLSYPTTDKDNASFESAWLEEQDHEFYQLIAKTRKLNRSGSVFIQSKILDMEVGGVIYPSFKQSKSDTGGTKSGRFSSANPNVQQVPSRGEFAKDIRSLFIPEAGYKWLKADYKQQEPRVTVHYANALGLRGSQEAAERYVTNPETDYHQMVADMAQIPRSIAKGMNLGLAYGMGKAKMAASLGISLKEAEEVYDKYHANVPFVKDLSYKCSNLAEERGYIKTLSGRRRRFDLWGPKKYYSGVVPKSKEQAIIEYGYPISRYFTYRAMNALIQGSSADMLKLAMLDVHKAGYCPSLTVHDELDFTNIENDKQVKEINDIMVNCLNNHEMGISVPILVDMGIGKSWGELEEVRV